MTQRSKDRFSAHQVIIIFACLCIGLVVVGGSYTLLLLVDSATVRLHAEAQDALWGIAAKLHEKNNFRLLEAKTLAAMPELGTLLLAPSAVNLHAANALLYKVAQSLALDACYVIAPNGDTIAASNFDQPISFVGENYAFRPYFQKAMQGEANVQVAFGVTSRRRGAYTAAPLTVATEQYPLGVVVFKDDLSFLERWFRRLAAQGIVVMATPNGSVYASSSPDLLFTKLWNTADETAPGPGPDPGPGQWQWGGMTRVGTNSAQDRVGHRYTIHHQSIELLPGWELIFFHDSAAMHRRIYQAHLGGTAGLAFALCCLVIIFSVILYRKAQNDLQFRSSVTNALAASEAKFRGAFETAAHGLALVGLDGRFLEVNNSLTDIVGYSREALLELDFQTITHPDDLEADLEHVRRLLAGDIVSYQMEKRYLHHNGQVVWGLLSVSLVRDMAGKPLYFVSQIIDRTRLKMAEEAVQVQSAFFQSIIESIPNPLKVINVSDYSIALANPAAQARGVIVGEKCYAASHHRDAPCDGSEHGCPIKEILRTKQPVLMEHIHTDAHGVRRYVELQGFPIFNDSGNVVQVIETTVDITERRQAEEKIRFLNEDLEAKIERRTSQLQEIHARLLRREKLAVIGQMAGSVGHDLRNPLGAISNSIYFLSMKLPEPEEVIAKHLGIMRQQLNLANNIVAELLDFSRIGLLDRSSIELNPLIASVVQGIDHGSGIELVIEPDAALPNLALDEVKMRRVLSNLITNGVQAMADKGRLTVVTSLENDRCVIRITDSGCGIPPDMLATIFEPLVTTKPKGVGLGLAIVKNIIEQHGGAIGVESEQGKGTTFTVRLPLEETSIDG